MKYIKYLLFSIIILFVFMVNVDAKDKMDIISIGENNTITSKYDNLTYSNYGINIENNIYYFSSTITNNTKKYLPISFNVLLFDKDKKNIGIFNYCSTHDIETIYSYKEIEPNNKVDLKLEVSNKYLADQKKYKVSDIKYFAIQNDNIDCKIGGYNNLEGKTFSELNGYKEKEVSTDKTINIFGKSININFIKDKSFVVVAIVVAIYIFISIIIGILIEALYVKINSRTNGLCYIPIINVFMAAKVVFGNLIAALYFILYLISVGLVFINVKFLFIFMNFILSIILILIIVKLITKKYDLFTINIGKNGVQGFTKNDFKEEVIEENDNNTNEYGFNQQESDKETMKGSVSLDIDESNDNDNDIINNIMEERTLQEDNPVDNKINTDNNDDSDLSKFFR